MYTAHIPYITIAGGILLFAGISAVLKLRASGKPDISLGFDFDNGKALISVENKTSRELVIDNLHLIYMSYDPSGKKPSRPIINAPNTMRRTSFGAGCTENFSIRALTLTKAIESWGISNIKVLCKLTVMNQRLRLFQETFYHETFFDEINRKWEPCIPFNKKWRKYFRLDQPYDYTFED